MLKKLKLYTLAFVAVLSLLSFTVLTPPSFFGKSFNASKDFNCCKGAQLYLHHYYDYYVCGLKVTDGYTLEALGKPSAEGCNIQCND